MCGPPVLWDSAGTRPHRDARLWQAQRWAQQRDALGGGRAGSEVLGPAGPRAQQSECGAGRGGRHGQEMVGCPGEQGPWVDCYGKKIAAGDWRSSYPKAQEVPPGSEGSHGSLLYIPGPTCFSQRLAARGPSAASSLLAAPKATPQEMVRGSSIPTCHVWGQALHGVGLGTALSPQACVVVL